MGVLFITGTVAGILSVIVTGGFAMDAPAYVAKAASDPGQIQLGAFFVLVMGLALSRRLGIGRGPGARVLPCNHDEQEPADHQRDIGKRLQRSPEDSGILLVDAQDQISAVTSIVFGIGALMLYYLMYRGRLIPRWISGWGIVAAVLTLVGALIALFGTAQDIWAMPMLPQEMVMAVWLIAKGFSPSTTPSESGQQLLAGR